MTEPTIDQKPGKLIFLDGPDGAGKTTQIEAAKAALEADGHDVYLTRINGGTPFGEALRTVVLSDIDRNPMTEHCVFMAMHSQLRQELAPQLAAGKIVLIDRSPLSDWAYQKFGGQLDSPEFERDLDQSMRLFAPSLIICYTLSLETIKQRIHSRREAAKLDYFESKPADFFARVIEGYDFAANRYNATRIDAEGSIDDVHTQTMQAILSVL